MQGALNVAYYTVGKFLVLEHDPSVHPTCVCRCDTVTICTTFLTRCGI